MNKSTSNPYKDTPITQPNDPGCKICKDWNLPMTGRCWDCRGHDLWRPASTRQIQAFSFYKGLLDPELREIYRKIIYFEYKK